MKIGELASRSGLNASAIRYYEKMRLLDAPYRIGGQRRYANETLSRVLLIRFAGDMGFTLGEIRLFLSGLRENVPVGPRWKKLTHRKLAEIDVQIQNCLRLKELLKRLLRCHCASLQVCVHRLSLCSDLRSISPSVRSQTRARRNSPANREA